jgi:hypothetical protein
MVHIAQLTRDVFEISASNEVLLRATFPLSNQ